MLRRVRRQDAVGCVERGVDAIGLRPVDAGVPAAGLPFPALDGMRNASVFGLYEADATKLAERARWN